MFNATGVQQAAPAVAAILPGGADLSCLGSNGSARASIAFDAMLIQQNQDVEARVMRRGGRRVSAAMRQARSFGSSETKPDAGKACVAGRARGVRGAVIARLLK
ncbi:hypothetical protein E4Z66_05360 [Aliishimia ponticola]|uniref:Uncharacterized protein n=1 Tax=Aliishimia ponticola TaxID=2499833 RepID=A0A4S4NJP6_9RHOB|nr:hypothetical protein [Aliishimia ponticola]THH38987.1 hypothetical protein E4Z66_05360 [Aliishimia ponticola]